MAYSPRLSGCPEIDHAPPTGSAGAGEHLPPELDQSPLAAGLDEIGTLRGARLEIRPLGLARSWLIPVVALRRRSERLGHRLVEDEAGRGERAREQHAAAGGMRFAGHGGLLIGTCSITVLGSAWSRVRCGRVRAVSRD